MTMLYQELASIVQAMQNCAAKSLQSTDWQQRHAHVADYLARNMLPSGSGFDSGSRVDVDASRPDCLVLTTEFHHMNNGGFYDGWTSHTVRVRPSLIYGITLTVSGRDRNAIKDYIHEAFDTALREEVSNDMRRAAYSVKEVQA